MTPKHSSCLDHVQEGTRKERPPYTLHYILHLIFFFFFFFACPVAQQGRLGIRSELLLRPKLQLWRQILDPLFWAGDRTCIQCSQGRQIPVAPQRELLPRTLNGHPNTTLMRAPQLSSLSWFPLAFFTILCDVQGLPQEQGPQPVDSLMA